MGKIISSMLSGAPFFSDPLGTVKNSLVDILGFNIEIWQIILVGVLVVALIVALIIALVRPRKANKERVRQFIENEENAYKIRKQLSEKQREINEIRHTLNKRQFEYNRSVKKVKDDYNEAHSKEDREFFVATEKLGAMNENLRDLSVKLKKNPKGEALAALQAEFDKADSEHSAFAEKYSELRIEKSKRDDEYKNELKKLEDEFTFVKDDYEADIAERTKEIKKLEADLDKLENAKIRISSKDADAILEEFRKQEELDKQARLKQAEDDVEKAKGEYIDAQNLRIQYERDRIEAVNSAKEDSARKATLETARKETEAKVRYGAPSAHPANDEETEQISDVIKKSDDEKVAREYIEAAQAEYDLDEPVYNAEEQADNATVTETAEEEISATAAAEEGENNENATPEYQPNAIDALEELEQGMGDVDRKNREEVVYEVTEVEEAAEEAAHDDGLTEAEATQAEETDKVQEYNPALTDEETAVKETPTEDGEAAVETVEESNDNENIAEKAETKEETTVEIPNEETETVSEAEIAEADTDKSEQTDSDENRLEEIAAEAADDNLKAATEKIATEEVATEETAAAEADYEAEAYISETEPAEDAEAYNSEPETKEEVAAIEPATDEISKNGITEEITEKVGENNELVKDNAQNEEKIIRLPKIIHNDGIPATPIHKKSKFSKPVTKIVVKKASVKDETTEIAPAKEETKKSAYLGKWKTETTEDGKISAKLCASNGGVLLVTPAYTSDIGLKNGIASIKKHLAAGNVTITANKAGKFVFKITAPSGRTIVTSEQYGARFQCEKALDSAKRFAESAVIVE